MQKRFNDPPVREGEQLDVHIEAVGEKGDGVAKVKGFVLFVPNTQAGEDCSVKVTKVLQKMGFAEKVGSATGKPRASSHEVPEVESEPDPQDSEDFGEEEGEF